jgi:hypothetical protein
MLADLQNRHYYKCQFEIYDEVPRPGAITRMESDEQNSFGDWQDPDHAPFDSLFQGN